MLYTPKTLKPGNDNDTEVTYYNDTINPHAEDLLEMEAFLKIFDKANKIFNNEDSDEQ